MKTGPKPTPAIDRFWPKVQKTDTCWLWLGARGPAGYGYFWNGKQPMPVHRWSYEHFTGPIPAGLVIDHLCRVPACVNPAHLEAVTNHENVITRGVGPAARASRATRCKHGHPFDEANTYHVMPNGKSPTGSRRCRTCNAANRRRYLQRRAALVNTHAT